MCHLNVITIVIVSQHNMNENVKGYRREGTFFFFSSMGIFFKNHGLKFLNNVSLYTNDSVLVCQQKQPHIL